MEAVVSFRDIANQVYALSEKKDREVQDLMSQIESDLEVLNDTGFSNKDKLDRLTSVEYIFVKLRVLVEFESVKVKQLLLDPSTPPALKTFFTKRDAYLAQVSAKLTLIRDDIQVLQRIQYQVTNNLIK